MTRSWFWTKPLQLLTSRRMTWSSRPSGKSSRDGVCFLFLFHMMFWINVISKWPPSSPQHNHHDRPPVEHSDGLWQDPSLEGRGHCRAGHAQVYNIIVLHLGDLHCFFFFSNLLKIEGGIFQGMCQNAGVDLSFINRWVKCRSDSWISRNVCNCSNIVKHRQCRKFVNLPGETPARHPCVDLLVVLLIRFDGNTQEKKVNLARIS